MSDGISREIVKPHQCVMGFGIPTTWGAFAEVVDTLCNREFIPVYYRSNWNRYHHDVVRHFDDVLPELAALGVTICHKLTRGMLLNFLNDRGCRVFILFTHFNENAVELFDGLTGIDDFVDLVPCQFDGILDLCVCHPASLVKRLTNKRPSCLKRYSLGKATPVIWIYFYETLFLSLAGSDMNYGQVLRQTVLLMTGGLLHEEEVCK